MAENQNLIARLLVATGLVNEEQAGRAIAAAPDTEGGIVAAAVAAEAFDSTQWNTDETNNPFEFEDWVGFPSNSWASCWHTLFPTNDIRHCLTWRGRFAGVPQLTTLYNYYSTGDEVLSIFDTPDLDGSGKITIHPFGLGGKRYHAWQKQERFKGRYGIDPLAGFGGTSDMGWGFSVLGFWELGSPPMYTNYYVNGVLAMTHVRITRYTSAQAGAAIDAQLASDPVFRHDLMVGIPSGNMSDADKVFHLARGVPALSGPAGSHSFRDEIQVKNRDMDFLKTSPAWPRAGEQDFQGWRHSDIKDVALPFVLPVFERILSETTQ